MKTKVCIVITAILLTAVLGMVSTASADYFSDRQHQQKQRIRQGIASGQITPREAETLYQDQRKLRLMTDYAMADGHLSRKEARILLVYLELASNQIDRYKHNPHRVKPHRACRRGPQAFARR